MLAGLPSAPPNKVPRQLPTADAYHLWTGRTLQSDVSAARLFAVGRLPARCRALSHGLRRHCCDTAVLSCGRCLRDGLKRGRPLDRQIYLLTINKDVTICHISVSIPPADSHLAHVLLICCRLLV